MSKKIIDLITGARPNFMKVAPLFHVLQQQGSPFRARLIHTGQHYDVRMWQAFLRDFGLPDPDFMLEALPVGVSLSREEQIPLIEQAYRELLKKEGLPASTIVVGDVNSTLAAAQAARSLMVPVAHLEAGLRSGDWEMPEEHNRVATDRISDRLWTPSQDGDENLLKEGIAAQKIKRVGNVMIDSLLMLKDQIDDKSQKFLRQSGWKRRGYGVLTLHRPENVDQPKALQSWVKQVCLISRRLPLIFPLHPRTDKALLQAKLKKTLEQEPGLRLCPPLAYLEFMSWVSNAAFVLTDSGGVQEETTFLNIPCLTLRKNTERPITVSQGSNEILRLDQLEESLNKVLDGKWKQSICPDLWDGKTAQRVLQDLRDWI